MRTSRSTASSLPIHPSANPDQPPTSSLPSTSQETQCHSPGETKGLFFIVPVKWNQRSWLGLTLCSQSHSGPASLEEERGSRLFRVSSEK